MKKDVSDVSYGDGQNIRDWLYVEDHCRAIHSVVQHGRIGEVYNIGGDTELTNLQLVKKVLAILREIAGDDEISDHLIKFVKDRPGHDRRYAMDHTKITTELGWRPSVTIDEGLKYTIEWYIMNREWLHERLG